MHVLIQLQNCSWITKKNKSLLTLLEPQSNELLVYKLQSVHSKQKIMPEGNKLCMLQTRIKSH